MLKHTYTGAGFALALLLPGCTAYLYEPTLAHPPADPAQYKTDLRACQDDLQDMRWAGLFGIAGYAAEYAATGEDAVYGAHEIVSKCMARKGYDVR